MATAQPDLPAPSPKATVKQTTGLTDITVEYSSPAVKGRAIWGTVVPLNELWRTGANMATKVTFSRDVKIDGKEVKAGSYALFSIPGKDSWTLIINKNWNQGGTAGYKQDEDVVRVTVKPETITNRERLTFLITDFTDQEATISLEWEKVRVSLKVALATDDQAAKSIESTLGGAWRQYANAARYELENGKDLNVAMTHINQSITLSEQWYNVWIKAQILEKKGDKKEALKAAQRAKELGDKAGEGFFYKSDVEKAIATWK